VTAGTKLMGYLLEWRALFGASGWPRVSLDEEPPLRSELFSADQVEQHGKALAASHELAPGRAPDQLLPRARPSRRLAPRGGAFLFE
jgi:cyclic beta-1,2-glucan glucanotransferase